MGTLTTDLDVRVTSVDVGNFSFTEHENTIEVYSKDWVEFDGARSQLYDLANATLKALDTLG
jgi:hypothetical protein